MTYLRTGLSLTAALTLTVSLPGPILAQDGPGGLRGTISIDQRLEYETNPDFRADDEEGVFRARTQLGFAVSSETRVEQLEFFIGTDLVGAFGDGAEDDGSDDLDNENDRASLSYAREGANSALTFAARYSQNEIEDLIIDDLDLDGDFNPDILIFDGGRREVSQASLGYVYGTGGPFTLSLDGFIRNSDYVGTSDPELVDSVQTRASALAIFRINPTLAARARAGFSQEKNDTSAELTSTTRFVGVGLQGETRGGFSFSGDVLVDQSETEVFDFVVAEDDGVGVDIALSQDRPLGPLSFNLSSRIDEAGRRTQASVRRTLDLPDGGLGFSIGLLDQDGDDDLRVTTELDYRKETPRGALTASIAQTPRTEDTEAFLNTRLRVGYSQEINSVSGWNAEVDYLRSNQLDGNDDRNVASAALTYRRDLTEDWGLSAGLEHQRRDDDSGPTRTSNTVFFNIGRDISFGF